MHQLCKLGEKVAYCICGDWLTEATWHDGGWLHETAIFWEPGWVFPADVDEAFVAHYREHMEG